MVASFLPDVSVEIRHAHLFCGLGGFARGMNRARARHGRMVARFRCLGGVDVDAAAIADFERLTGVRGTVLDLFDREGYQAFHGAPPPEGWREATAADLQRAMGWERPHVLCTSPPCKGFSGLLSEERSRSERYQALNRLTIRGLRLALTAWEDDPPEFVIFENVPRIASRGRGLVDEIVDLLASFAYNVAETTHDCGAIGHLAQSRKRFLLVARHRERVRPHLFEPPKHRLRGVGEVLGAFPLPGDPKAGPMHRMRELEWRTWVRLAFVTAGGDWRSLEQLRVVDGRLADYVITPDYGYPGTLGVCAWDAPSGTVTAQAAVTRGPFAVADPRTEGFHGVLGVTPWDRPSGVVTGGAGPNAGRFAVADPRVDAAGEYGQLGVKRWDEPSNAVTAQSLPGGGRYSVADPRLPEDDGRHWNKFRVVDWSGAAGTVVANAHRPGGGEQSVADPRHKGRAGRNVYRVVRWEQAAGTVTRQQSPSSGCQAVTDPRAGGWGGRGKYRVTRFDEAAGAVIGASTTGNGAFAVADPRPDWALQRVGGSDWQTPGHYGVVPWDAPSGAVTGAAGHDNGRWNVADPRLACGDTLPAGNERLVAVIRALDGTWHRPFTTLELAALQDLVDPGEYLELEGLSDSAWRERIGNAVPPAASQAIGSVMGKALLLAWSGETFALDSLPVWVRPLAVGVAVEVPPDLW
jgi:site-specific DNA-cytosine methylase